MSLTGAASRSGDDAPVVDEHAALLQESERLLDGVDRALVSLDDGSYGTCEVCGTAIDDRELDADPVATRCSQHRQPQGE